MENHLHRKILAYLFMALCAIIPWSLAGMQIMLGLICVTFFTVSIINKKNYLIFHPIYIYIAIFLLSLTASALASSDIMVGLDNVLHTNWIILSVPFIASLPLSEHDRELTFKILVFSATIAGIYGIIQFFTGADIIRGRELGMLGSYYRATGPYEFYLSFAGNQLMVFGVAFIFVMDQWKNKTKEILYLFALVIIGLSIIATYGRSAWIGTVIIILLGTYLFYRQHFWKIIVALFIIAALVFISLPDIKERFLIIFDTGHKSNSGRINLWYTSLLIIKEYPWFGVGPGLFEVYFQQFKVPGLYDASGHAHNDYLHMAVQGGLAGLVTWLLIWIALFRYSYEYLITKFEDLKNTKLISAITLSIAGILVAALFQCYFVDLENSILWWVLVATAIQIFNQDKNIKN
jgi:putative inorganic carbon (HCO3(-)) transporter